MVDDRPIVELKTLWFPTRASAERSFPLQLEYNVNQIPRGHTLSVADLAWSTGDPQEALALLPAAVPEETRRRIEQLLQPWTEGRYTEAYHRSGGILNLFTPPWGEAQDEVWAGMVAHWEAGTYPGDEARQAALRELEQQWNQTPHPFFAGLSPAQVMVGGGPRERALATEFLERLAERFENHAFESEGESLITVVLLLRGWQCQATEDGPTIREVILAERDELLARRARVLGLAAEA